MNSLDQSWFFLMDDVQCVGPNCTKKTYFHSSFLMILKKKTQISPELSQSSSAVPCMLLRTWLRTRSGHLTAWWASIFYIFWALSSTYSCICWTHTHTHDCCINQFLYKLTLNSWLLGRMCCILWQCQRSWSLVGWAWAPACAPPARQQQSKENPEDVNGT